MELKIRGANGIINMNFFFFIFVKGNYILKIF